MARRSKDEAEETREQIVEAAIRLFLRDGVSQTTLEKIAAEAGFTRGAVYHHFENKAKLLLELMQRAHPPAQEIFNCMTPQEGRDPLETLEDAIVAALDRLLTDKTSRDIHSIFIFNCEFIEKANPIFEPECNYARASRTKVCEYLEKAKQLKLLRQDMDTEETSLIIMSYCFGIMSTALRNPWQDTKQIDKRRAMEIFFKGLRADSANPSIGQL